MIKLDLAFEQVDSQTILCIGAHSDDIEIGALATVLSLGKSWPNLNIVWVVFSAVGERRDEALASANRCVQQFNSHKIIMYEFRDGYFPADVPAIKSAFEEIKSSCSPELIVTHYRQDAHQDHRIISDLSWQTFRNHAILEYEIPKYDGDIGIPNVFHPVSESEVDEKLGVLQEFFSSQHSKPWFSPETFRALMRIRGIECNSESGYAEAFYGRKLII